MRLTSHSFNEVALPYTRSGLCSVCGKKRSRSRKFWQTMNPFNKDASGAVKDRRAIQAELRAECDAWLKTPLICKACEETAP